MLLTLSELNSTVKNTKICSLFMTSPQMNGSKTSHTVQDL